jgi:hypothetical protein
LSQTRVDKFEKGLNCSPRLDRNLRFDSFTATSGLSKIVQVILHADAEKYGKVLLQFEQNRLGQAAGVLRCMELQSLLWTAISSTHIARECTPILTRFWTRDDARGLCSLFSVNLQLMRQTLFDLLVNYQYIQ